MRFRFFFLEILDLIYKYILYMLKIKLNFKYFFLGYRVCIFFFKKKKWYFLNWNFLRKFFELVFVKLWISDIDRI